MDGCVWRMFFLISFGLVQRWVWLTAWKQQKSLTGWLSLFLGHLWRVLLHLSENIQSDRPSLTRATWCVLSTRVPEVALCVSYVVVLGHGVLSEVCWCVAWTVVSGECAFLGLVQCWVWLTAWKQWNSLTGWLSLFLGHLWRVLLHLSENIQSDRPSLTRATWCVLSNAACMCWDSYFMLFRLESLRWLCVFLMLWSWAMGFSRKYVGA